MKINKKFGAIAIVYLAILVGLLYPDAKELAYSYRDKVEYLGKGYSLYCCWQDYYFLVHRDNFLCEKKELDLGESIQGLSADKEWIIAKTANENYLVIDKNAEYDFSKYMPIESMDKTAFVEFINKNKLIVDFKNLN